MSDSQRRNVLSRLGDVSRRCEQAVVDCRGTRGCTHPSRGMVILCRLVSEN